MTFESHYFLIRKNNTDTNANRRRLAEKEKRLLVSVQL